MTDESCEAMCELVWTASRKDLNAAMGGCEVAADSALESLVACVDKLRQACNLI